MRRMASAVLLTALGLPGDLRDLTYHLARASRIDPAAGLDARPYRMSLPASLKWIEVDLPEILTYKEDILKGERPNCVLERVRLDLLNVDARRALLEQVGRRARRALIITEGLLIYLTPAEVAALARPLASPAPLQD